MAILHPLECYLLEQFSSPGHFAATRDAIIAFIEAHEAAFERLQRELPVRIRSEPLWQQGDVVWGSRVLPNIRPSRARYIDAYILRTHNDPEAFYKVGHTMSNLRRGIGEFWDGWMMEEEKARVRKAGIVAAELDKKLTLTVSGHWQEGDLTYFQNDLYQLKALPRRIPRYVLDKSVRVEKGEKPFQTGIYLPDVEIAPAQLLYPDRHTDRPVVARQGVKRSESANPDGTPDFNWQESRWAETGWTLIRRVEGEYLDVPPEGFFPGGTPEELYSWPEREKDYITREAEYISAWSGEASPHSGDWSVFTGSEMKNISLGQGQILPYLSGVNDSPERVCWTLIKRDDNGSVFRTK